jgi:hypothetical protein
MIVASWGRHQQIQDGRWIVGDRLTFETIGDPPARLRLAWDISDPASMTWRNEISVSGGPWSLVEEYHCQRIANQTPAPEGGDTG